MAQISAIDAAYNVLAQQHNAMAFEQLWNQVLSVLSIDEKLAKSKKVKLYSAMMLDPRFTSLKDNTWDLAERVKYEQKHIDTSEIELDDDDEEIEDEELVVDSDDVDYDSASSDENSDNDEDLL